jgi:hypothetical protein
MPTGGRLEKLTIENFAGIRHLEMDVSPFTVLIGPQSVGKSVTAKVLYFFKTLPRTLLRAADRDEVLDVREAIAESFFSLFPQKASIQGRSTLRWSGGSESGFEIEVKANRLTILLPEEVRNAYGLLARQRKDTARKQNGVIKDIDSIVMERARAEHNYLHAVGGVIPGGVRSGYFIPAGRSFYAQIQRDAASFYSTAKIDPYVGEFGKLLAALKGTGFWRQSDIDRGEAGKLVNELLSGEYSRKENEDLILSADGRLLPSEFWSSGQQEAYPLALMLQDQCSGVFDSSDIVIEEPEAHLFPTSQRVMTELIALAFNTRLPQMRVFLTTHSPYILTTMNNLLQAGLLYAEELSDERKKALANIVPKDRALAPGSVGVFYMDRDSCHSIMDEETGLIGTSEIDEASGKLSDQFEALLDEAYRP